MASDCPFDCQSYRIAAATFNKSGYLIQDVHVSTYDTLIRDAKLDIACVFNAPPQILGIFVNYENDELRFPG